MPIPSSIPGVVDVIVVRPDVPVGRPLLVELPHGATRTAEYDALAARLRGPFPSGLVDFFHVNTDAGTPELGAAIAAAWPGGAVVVRSCIPRTFIDCNRVIGSSAEAFKAGKVTPGVPPYVRDTADLALLHDLHRAYIAAADEAYEAVCGADGAALLLHSYAPRSVGVEVDDDIVASLRRAYEPDVEPTWPLRPPLDLIAVAPDGTRAVDIRVLHALRAGLAPLHVGDSETYPFAPVTQAHVYATRYPGQTVCLEVRRDLLADPFTPFAQMRISAEQVARLTGPIVAGLEALG